MRSTQFVLFGVTGDLARNKIIPALFNLYMRRKKEDPGSGRGFRLIGYGRRHFTGAEFREYVGQIKAIADLKDVVHDARMNTLAKEFLQGCFYVQGELDDDRGFTSLKAMFDKGNVADPKEDISIRMFYISLAPNLQAGVAERLHGNKLLNGTSRILLEKPFGMDASTAIAFDARLRRMFGEDPIYRVDHYLGKEALLGLYDARFGSSFLTSFWNDSHIASFHITLHEKKTAEGRGALYDSLGVTRDVVQNHVVQIMAGLISKMPDFEGRSKAIASLSIVPKSVIRAQYKRYQDEKNVAPDSQTETFISFEARSSFPLWKKTRFFVSAGKAMKETTARVRIIYRDRKMKSLDILFSPVLPAVLRNKVGSVDAYETLLDRAFSGDKKIFVSLDEAVAGWKFLEKIYKEIRIRKTPLRIY